jgi:peptidoglycan glycosyltransferase
VRVSLVIHLQALASDLLGNHSGTIVLLNAGSGELLAMASTPSFDANRLEEDWGSLVQDSRAPLINRATQGIYPPGAALGPVLLAHQIRNGNLPDPFDTSSITIDGQQISCVTGIQDLVSSSAISSGCPKAVLTLAGQMGPQGLREAFGEWGLLDPLQVSLPMAEANPPSGSSIDENLFGAASLQTTPLQVALASAALSADGAIPTPRLVLAVHTPDQGWVVFPQSGQTVQAFPPDSAAAAARQLTQEGDLFWNSISVSPRGDLPPVTWYVGGTLPGGQVTPLTAVVLIEGQNPAEAGRIGEEILLAALHP